MSEKQHPPSARKLADARRQGQVARSRLFGAAGVVAGTLAGLAATAAGTAAELRALTASVLGPGAPAPVAALGRAGELLLRGLVPVLGGAWLGALAAGLATAGLRPQPSLVAPRLERLDPVAGLRRLVSLERLADLGKGLLVTALLAGVVVGGVREVGPAALRAVWRDGATAMLALGRAWWPVLLRASLLLGLVGAADLALARRRHRRRLRMSHEELKQEHRNAEGDPRARGQRRALHRRLASGATARGVASATVVVVNPTHLAVALRYHEAECDAPYVVARGRELDALRLRRHAEVLGLPVVRDIPLARSLVRLDVGEEIPEELYQAAAAVLKVALEAAAGGEP